MPKPACYMMHTPLGEIRIHACGGIPVGISLAGGEAGRDPVRSPPPVAVARIMRAVDDFFAGKDIDSAFAESLLAYVEITPFSEAVLREVIAIPRGETRSYGEVAEGAGYARAARAVGNVMRSNPYPIIIPCHRVVKGDGTLGGYGGAEHLKAWLLRFEGAPGFCSEE